MVSVISCKSYLKLKTPLHLLFISGVEIGNLLLCDCWSAHLWLAQGVVGVKGRSVGFFGAIVTSSSLSSSSSSPPHLPSSSSSSSLSSSTSSRSSTTWRERGRGGREGEGEGEGERGRGKRGGNRWQGGERMKLNINTHNELKCTH